MEPRKSFLIVQANRGLYIVFTFEEICSFSWPLFLLDIIHLCDY